MDKSSVLMRWRKIQTKPPINAAFQLNHTKVYQKIMTLQLDLQCIYRIKISRNIGLNITRNSRLYQKCTGKGNKKTQGMIKSEH